MLVRKECRNGSGPQLLNGNECTLEGFSVDAGVFEEIGFTMNVTQYKGTQNLGLSDTSRGFSPAIWSDCPWNEIACGYIDGIALFDDFLNGPRVAAGAEAAYGSYRGFADTGGLVQDGGEWGGTLDLSSDGDNEGASFRTSCNPFQIARAQGKFWFEARVKSSTITDTKHNLFVGLMADNALTATVPITAAGALADINIVGFHRTEAASGGALMSTTYKADGVTAVTVQAGAVAVAADTYVKLGIVFDPRTNVVTFFRNGVKLSTTYTVVAAAGTDFPNDVRLGLVIAVLNATGTTPGSSEIDWWRAAQLAP